MNAFSLSAFEFRRFTRAKLTRIGLVGLTMVPLLYAGLYLWSFWNPTEHMNRVPVALVVEDRPAKTVNAGADLAKELEDRATFKWVKTDAASAKEGVESGRYYMSLTIPSDFSTNITSPSGDGRVENAQLKVHLNDANSYVMGSVADLVFNEIGRAAGQSASKGYFDNVFVSFGTLHDKMKEAANGAGDLHDGLGTAADGSQKLADGLGTLSQGSAQLSDGLRTLNTTVHGYTDRLVPLLSSNVKEIQQAARAVGKTANAVSNAADRLPELTSETLRKAKAARAELAASEEIPPRLKTRLLAAADETVSAATKLDTYAKAHLKDLDTIADKAKEVRDRAFKLEREAPGLANRINAAVAGVDKLSDGATRLKDGSRTAHAAALELNGGLDKLNSGADKLASGLTSGYKQIPDYGSNERDERSEMMSRPVRLDEQRDNAVPNYGTGFASFFVPLSLWVGSMLTYMMFKPLNGRALAGNAPPWRVAIAGWLPAAVLGVIQVTVVLAVLKLALGFNPEHLLGLWAFLSLAAASFNAVVQWANAQFGAVGKLVTLILLMLQLTSSAGTYPIETSPGFFQAIQNYLPMPWAIRGMRHLVGGGDMTSVWQACGVFVLFIIGALALTSVAARAARVWSLDKLRPAITL